MRPRFMHTVGNKYVTNLGAMETYAELDQVAIIIQETRLLPSSLEVLPSLSQPFTALNRLVLATKCNEIKSLSESMIS